MIIIHRFYTFLKHVITKNNAHNVNCVFFIIGLKKLRIHDKQINIINYSTVEIRHLYFVHKNDIL